MPTDNPFIMPVKVVDTGAVMAVEIANASEVRGPQGERGEQGLPGPSTAPIGFDELDPSVLNFMVDSGFRSAVAVQAAPWNQPFIKLDVFSNLAGIDATNSSGYAYDAVNHLVKNTQAIGATTLLHMDSGAFADEAGHTVTPTGAVCDGATMQFGTGSLTTGYLTSVSDDFVIGSGVDCTIDFWFYPTDTIAEQGMLGMWDVFNAGDFLVAYLYQGMLYLGTASGGHQLSVTAPDTGGWHHLAIVRSSGTVTGYLDGVSFGSTANTNALSEHALIIGSYGNSAIFTGYIDEFRLLVGTAAWTDTFTPPTEAYAYGAGISDFVLQSVASATPAATKADVMLNAVLPSGASLNSDVCGYVSVDGGSNFTQVTLSQQGDNGDGSVRLFGSLTGLTAGESLCIKVIAAGSAGVTQVWDWAMLAGT